MKRLISILNILFVVSTAIFVLATFAMFLVQCFSLGSLNGGLSVNIYNYVVKTAGPISAVPAVIAIVLGYINKEKAEEDKF